MQNTTLDFVSVSSKTLQDAYHHKHNPHLMQSNNFQDRLLGDKIRLQQIMINMISNAIKFAPGGAVRIYMAYDYEKEKLRVHIHDNGVGIADEDLPLIFSNHRRTA